VSSRRFGLKKQTAQHSYPKSFSTIWILQGKTTGIFQVIRKSCVKSFSPVFKIMKTTASKITGLLILASIFVSCGAESTGTPNTTESVSTTTAAAETDANQPVFPEIFYDGDEILFLTEDWRFGDIYDSKEIYAESIDGSLINDAVYNRNQRVQEQFDVVIKAEMLPLANEVAFQNIMAGDNTYDVVMPYLNSSVVNALEGLYGDTRLL